MFSEDESIERSLRAIRRITRAIDLHSKQLVAQCQLTGPQLVILREVARLGSPRIGALALRVSLSNATLTGIVDRLERRGLVSRVRCAEDRRQVLVSITETGQALLGRAPALLQDRFVREMGDLAEPARHVIVKALEQVAAMMGAQDMDAAPYLASAAIDAPGLASAEVPGVPVER